MELSDYLPILIMAVLAALFAGGARLTSNLLRPDNPTPEKLDPYECGIVPERESSERFPVQFYLVAMVFIAFDIEIIYLYPWAVQMQRLQLFGVIEMAIFVGIVFIAYGYIRREGVLDWAPRRRVSRDELMARFGAEADAAAARSAAEQADARERDTETEAA